MKKFLERFSFRHHLEYFKEPKCVEYVLDWCFSYPHPNPKPQWTWREKYFYILSIHVHFEKYGFWFRLWGYGLAIEKEWLCLNPHKIVFCGIQIVGLTP